MKALRLSQLILTLGKKLHGEEEVSVGGGPAFFTIEFYAQSQGLPAELQSLYRPPA